MAKVSVCSSCGTAPDYRYVALCRSLQLEVHCAVCLESKPALERIVQLCEPYIGLPVDRWAANRGFVALSLQSRFSYSQPRYGWRYLDFSRRRRHVWLESAELGVLIDPTFRLLEGMTPGVSFCESTTNWYEPDESEERRLNLWSSLKDSSKQRISLEHLRDPLTRKFLAHFFQRRKTLTIVQADWVSGLPEEVFGECRQPWFEFLKKLGLTGSDL